MVGIYWVMTMVGVILAIPFFTLYERKILSYVQERKGPNKVGIMGLGQPIMDGVKLILKGFKLPLYSKMKVFWGGSLVCFLVMLGGWFIYPSFLGGYYLSLGGVGLLAVMSFNMYGLVGSGWSSNAKYSLLGSVRGAAQMISYEVSLMFIVLYPLMSIGGLKLWSLHEKGGGVVILGGVGLVVWLFMVHAETKRAPFDFAEGESELVSGFNTEYSGLTFAYLFLGEYGSILLMGALTSLMFFPVWGGLVGVGGVVVSSVMVWSRGTFPRFRYDFLMDVAWKVLLPLSLGLVGIIFWI